MAEYKLNFTPELLFGGERWLENWLVQIDPQKPEPKYDMPPKAAAGAVVVALNYSAEFVLYVANLRKQGLGVEQITNLIAAPAPWTELGNFPALKASAAELPDDIRPEVEAIIYSARHFTRRMYRESRPARATTSWALPTEVPGAVAWIWPLTVFGVAAVAAGAWYGAKKAEAGVAVQAKTAIAAAQAWRDYKVAIAQVAAGQKPKLSPMIYEAAKAEGWLPYAIGGTAVAAVGAAGAGIYYGMKRPKRRNPSHRRRRATSSSTRRGSKRERKCLGVPVLFTRSAGGQFRAYILVGGKRGAPINVSGAKTYDDAHRKACAEIRKLKKKNPKKKRATKRRTTRKRTTRRKRTPTRKRRRNPPRRKKTTRRKKVAAKRSSGGKAAFIRAQRRKGASPKQAQARWKFKQAAKKRGKAGAGARRRRNNPVQRKEPDPRYPDSPPTYIVKPKKGQKPTYEVRTSGGKWYIVSPSGVWGLHGYSTPRAAIRAAERMQQKGWTIRRDGSIDHGPGARDISRSR